MSTLALSSWEKVTSRVLATSASSMILHSPPASPQMSPQEHKTSRSDQMTQKPSWHPPARSPPNFSHGRPGHLRPRALSASSTFSYASQETVTGEELLTKQPSLVDEFGEHGQARLDVKPRPTNKQRAFWKPQRQQFPVSVQQVISLPTGEPTPIPKIQHTFTSESSRQKADRVKKQTAVREAFKHAWSGYKAAAWGHDELKPLTNGSADPFNGWGATLVDSLDTLWIMGLKEEFEEAVQQVSQINFKTSARKDIPMF